MHTRTLGCVLGATMLLSLALAPCQQLRAQGKATYEKRIQKLENTVKILSDRIKVLEARLTALEGKASPTSIEGLRQQAIEANRNAIVNEINNLAANAYQYRIKPKSMGGGGGSFTGYTIPSKSVETSQAAYTVAVSADEVVFTGKSKLQNGTISATLTKDGRLGDFMFTGDFE